VLLLAVTCRCHSNCHPHQMPHPQQRNSLAALCLSSMSASIAESATYPIDAIKTQLQLQRSTAGSAKPAGAIQLARQVLQRNGWAGLYAGLSPAALRHVFYTGTPHTHQECSTAEHKTDHSSVVSRGGWLCSTACGCADLWVLLRFCVSTARHADHHL
jgi:hypothetical protein